MFFRLKKIENKTKKNERIAGIEPAPLAWKARALPLCNIRVNISDIINTTLNFLHCQDIKKKQFENKSVFIL